MKKFTESKTSKKRKACENKVQIEGIKEMENLGGEDKVRN